MSKDYFLFEEEPGEIAYMAGVVDMLPDIFTGVCDFGNTFDADIFFVKDNDFSLLNDIIKKRLHHYNSKEGLNIPEQKIENLDFRLKAVNTDVKQYLYDVFSDYSSNKTISAQSLHQKIDKFFLSLNWYLREPVCIYEPVKESFSKTRDVLGQIYLYIAFQYFFIAYDEWLVLFVFGTAE